MNSTQYLQKLLLDNAWLNLDDAAIINVSNPLANAQLETIGLDVVRLMANKNYLSYAAKVLCNVDCIPLQSVILEELWQRPFPLLIGSRGLSKTFILSLYSLLRCVLVPNTKVIVCGASFRQSKMVFEYVERIWNNAPILRSLCDNNSGPYRETDRVTFRVNDSTIVGLPIGTGDKIRGLRGNIIIADEFAAHSPEIFETVIQGFGAVSQHPVENVKEIAKRRKLLELGVPLMPLDIILKQNNQIIISGTADYDFHHFATYWKRNKSIVESNGDLSILRTIFNSRELPASFDWRDYSVIRVPYELIPEGFMDDKTIARARATSTTAIYQMEYGAVFIKDSDGFFKRSIIDRCVATDNNVIVDGWPSRYCPNPFDALVYGSQDKKYVFGIDPASERDNFSIIVLEVNPDHSRIVYCWATNRDAYKQHKTLGLTQEADFYSYCIRKIRDLMLVFPCVRIGIDAQGGGIVIEESLHNPLHMKANEHLIWQIIDPEKAKPTDIESGLHILEMCQFARSEWVSEANHGLRKALEDRTILFPRYDVISLEMAEQLDRKHNNEAILVDSLEDCMLEIEALKDELCTIVLTRTGTGVNSRDRWDTPETKLASGKKGRLRKDRYSALLIAHMMARSVRDTKDPVTYNAVGGFSKSLSDNKHNNEQIGPAYSGPEWITGGLNDMLDFYGQ